MNDAGVWLLSTRHIQPRGAGEFDFVWTHFGFEDDTPEMTERRPIQAARYVETVVRTTAGLRFAARHCIYDSEMIPNAIIYPL